MIYQRELPKEFLSPLMRKEEDLIKTYIELRDFIFDRYSGINELLYHTHALTSVFTVSQKMSDGFCLIPIYKVHFNLGFQKGVLLSDPSNLLVGTGKLMRHIPIKKRDDFLREEVKQLLDEAYTLALEDADHIELTGKIISRIPKGA